VLRNEEDVCKRVIDDDRMERGDKLLINKEVLMAKAFI